MASTSSPICALNRVLGQPVPHSEIPAPNIKNTFLKKRPNEVSRARPPVPARVHTRTRVYTRTPRVRFLPPGDSAHSRPPRARTLAYRMEVSEVCGRDSRPSLIR